MIPKHAFLAQYLVVGEGQRNNRDADNEGKNEPNTQQPHIKPPAPKPKNFPRGTPKKKSLWSAGRRRDWLRARASGRVSSAGCVRIPTHRNYQSALSIYRNGRRSQGKKTGSKSPNAIEIISSLDHVIRPSLKAIIARLPLNLQ